MRMNHGMYMSSRADYETPPSLFQQVDLVFNFNLDVCASAQNAKVENFIDETTDGLKTPWRKFVGGEGDNPVCWMNPPWGIGVGDWTAKAVHESKVGSIVVGLLGARTDTYWFHQDVARANYILFLMGRVKFLLPCILCGKTTVKRRKPSSAIRAQLIEAGMDELTVQAAGTFPVCDTCVKEDVTLWHKQVLNSPAVGSMIPIWLPAGYDLRDCDVHHLAEMGWLARPERRV
jgi:phage N-6-adenine-methyltransferase